MKIRRTAAWTKNRSRHFAIGLGLAFVLCTLAFNYTSYEDRSKEDVRIELIPEDNTPITRTKREKKKKLPPVKVKVAEELKEIKSEEFVEDDQPEVSDDAVIDSTIVEDYYPQVDTFAPSVTPFMEPELPIEPVDKVWIRVERMPRFADCEKADNPEECTERHLLKFIHSRIKYPRIARANGAEGKVYVRFVVERDGAVTEVEILRDFGMGSGTEVERVVGLLPNFIPGQQGIHKVKVQFTLPISFELSR